MSVAAIIPARDAASTIEVAVESVVGQTLAPERILVIDDGSSDETASVARSAGAEVIPASNPASGPAAARNDGLRACRTTWAAFLDADDCWLANHLATAVPILERYGPALFAGSALQVDETGSPAGRTVARLTRSDPLEALLLGELLVTTSAAVVDVARCLDAGGFDERFAIPSCEDWDLWTRLSAPGAVVTAPNPTVVYRVADARSRASRMDVLAGYRRDALDRCLRRNRVAPSVEGRARSWLAFDLGRKYLNFGRAEEARRMLAESLRRSPVRLAAWGLLLLSLMPASTQAYVRQAKRRLAG